MSETLTAWCQDLMSYVTLDPSITTEGPRVCITFSGGSEVTLSQMQKQPCRSAPS